MPEPKPRRTIFDTLKKSAENRLGLAAAAKMADEISAFPESRDHPVDHHPEPSTNTEQDKGAGQRGRTKGQDKGAGQRGKGAGQRDSSTEQFNRALQKGSLIKQFNGAGQRDRTKEQDKGAVQTGKESPLGTFIPILLEPPTVARTPAQRRVLRYFEAHGTHVSNYDKIIEETGLPYNTVRKGIQKLLDSGLLSKSRWSQGSSRGLLFTFHSQEGTENGAGQKSREQEQFNGAEQRGITKEQDNGAGQNTSYMKIDRKNLSISLPILVTTWPNLSRCGFGVEQIDQIVENLIAIGKPTDRIVLGLDHLEYELANGQLVDKDGQPVADPCSWAFRALAQNGYYRRPKGYVSPEEQAARDAEEEARAVIAARQKAEQAQFEAWRDGLNAEKLHEAMKGHPGGPKDAWLKSVWKKKADKS
jgi:hypothetical protein